MACGDLAWRELWTEFNRLTTDTIRIRRAALREVVECAGGMPDNLIAVAPRSDSNTVEVRRNELFSFLKQHGGQCANSH
jgi:hypothetical protein